MSALDHQLPEPSATSDIAAPPHPFRAAPWYDPRVQSTPRARPARRSIWRLVLVVTAGFVLPLVSISINASMQVVTLGRVGVVFVILSSLAVLANAIWVPVRRAGRGSTPEVSAPAATWARVALFCGALLSLTLWAYIGLLFLPMLPLSVVAIAFVGLGFCGLCPYLTGAVLVVQALRVGRLVAERIGRRATVLLLAGTVLAPLASAGGLALHHALRTRAVQRGISKVLETAPYSMPRMRAIDQLAGLSDRLPAAYVESQQVDQRRIIAEIYQRLEDRPIDSQITRRRRRRGQIHPWWFVYGNQAFSSSIFEPLLF